MGAKELREGTIGPSQCPRNPKIRSRKAPQGRGIHLQLYRHYLLASKCRFEQRYALLFGSSADLLQANESAVIDKLGRLSDHRASDSRNRRSDSLYSRQISIAHVGYPSRQTSNQSMYHPRDARRPFQSPRTDPSFQGGISTSTKGGKGIPSAHVIHFVLKRSALY